MKLHDELKMLQNTWEKSKSRTILEPIPDGKYQAKIVDNRLERSKSSNRLQVVTVLQITKGEKEGRMVYKYSGLETENNISFLKTDLKAIGLGIPKNIVNISKTLEESIDKVINLEVKTNGEFTNIYFRKLDEEQVEESIAEDDVSDEEDDEDIDAEEDEKPKKKSKKAKEEDEE
jgi:hypothetical protein